MLLYTYTPGAAEEDRRKEIVAYLVGRYEKSKCPLCGQDWKDGGTTGMICALQVTSESLRAGGAPSQAMLPVVCECGGVQLFAADALPEQLRSNR